MKQHWASSILFSLLMVTTASTALAADQQLEQRFEVVSTEPIVSAYGVVLDTSEGAEGSKESLTRKAAITVVDDNHWNVVIRLEPADLEEHKRLTAVAVTRSGKLIPSEVRWIVEPSSVALTSTHCLSRDPSSEAKLRALDKDALQALVQIRRTRAEVLRGQLTAALNVQTIAQLTGIEKDLGLGGAERLSGKLPVEELAHRVGAIKAVLKSR